MLVKVIVDEKKQVLIIGIKSKRQCFKCKIFLKEQKSFAKS